MKLLDLYIGRTVLQSVGVVMFILLALFAFATFAGELDRVGQGDYGAWEAVQYSALLMPRLAYQLFPLTVLLGSIIGLGMMAGNSELIIVRSAGISVGRIFWSVMKVGLLLVFIMALMGEFVAPEADLKAQRLKAEALSERVSFRTDLGLWARDGNNVIHIRDLLSDTDVVNVSIYEFNPDNSLKVVTRAKRARFIDGAWQLQEVARSSIDAAGVKTEQRDQMTWQSLLKPELIGVVTVKPEFLSAVGLFNYISYLDDNNLEAGPYILALWKKLMMPLTTAVMIFLAVPFVFGSLRSVGIGQRIFVGTLLGIGFFLIDQTLAQVGLVYDLPPLLAVSVAPGLFLCLATYLVWRNH